MHLSQQKLAVIEHAVDMGIFHLCLWKRPRIRQSTSTSCVLLLPPSFPAKSHLDISTCHFAHWSLTCCCCRRRSAPQASVQKARQLRRRLLPTVTSSFARCSPQLIITPGVRAAIPRLVTIVRQLNRPQDARYDCMYRGPGVAHDLMPPCFCVLEPPLHAQLADGLYEALGSVSSARARTQVDST